MKQKFAIKPFGLRLPQDLRVWLEGRAERNGRSINSEVVQVLRSEWQRETARDESWPSERAAAHREGEVR